MAAIGPALPVHHSVNEHFPPLFTTRFSRYFVGGNAAPIPFNPASYMNCLRTIAILIRGREDKPEFQADFREMAGRLNIPLLEGDIESLEEELNKERATRLLQTFHTYHARVTPTPT